jgi:hypothetical protein
MKRIGVVAVGTLLAMGAVVTGLAGSAGAAPKPAMTTVKSVSPDHGATSGGTVVTIKGKNVIGVTAVDFGNTPAQTFTPKGNNSIVATSPAELEGTVDVTVTTSLGTSVTSPADEFTYVGGAAVQSVSPRIGADTGGTRVTIAGTGFTGATEVQFGSTSVPFTIDSDLAISTVSPSNGGVPAKVDVTVTGPDGTTPIDPADVFTFAVRVPVVSSIEPQSGAVGTEVTITGSRFTKKGTTVDFGSTPATSFTVVNSKTITAEAPAGTGTVDITVSDAKGTSSASSADQFTYASPAT